MKLKTILLLVTTCLLFLIALTLRSRFLLSGDFFFLSDQARDLLLVRDMVESHKPPLIGARAGLGGLFHGPLWIWFLSIPFLLFKGNPLLIASSYTLVSLSIVVTVFIGAKILYGWKGGIFSLLLVTFSPKLINIVPLTTNAQIMPLVFSFYLLFLILYLRGSKKSFFICAFMAGLGFQFQQAFSFLLLPYLIILSLFKDKFILNLKNFFLTIISFLLPLSTFLLFDIKHKFLITSSVLKILTKPGSLEPIKGYEKYTQTIFRVGDRFSLFTKLFDDLISPANSILFMLMIIIFIVGSVLIFTAKNKQLKTEYLTLLLLPVFAFAVYILYPFPLWEHYLFSTPIVTALILTLPFIKISQYLVGKVVVLIFIILLIKPFLGTFNSSLFQKTYLKNEGSYLSQIKVVDYIFKDSKKQQFGYFVYSPQVLTYGMDYLFWWRGKYLYNYLPVSQKLNPYYLVMSPPLTNDKDAHKYWIKNRIRSTSPPGLKTSIDGIDIEKRKPIPNEESVDPNYYLNIR